jgi:ubiquinone/menaquinone biosynthesis C-methylase UbiE
MWSTTVSVVGEGSRSWVTWLYAGWSKVYDATIDWDPAYRDNVRELVEETTRAGDEVLEVGIGTGIVAEAAAPTAARYVGIDYSGAMLAKAARKIAELRLTNISLNWGDARRLSWDDESFDVVLSSFVLPHFARDERGTVIVEMARVLRPGGRLGLFLAQGELFPVFSKRSELEKYLHDAGFAHVNIVDRDDIYRVVVAKKPRRVR